VVLSLAGLVLCALVCVLPRVAGLGPDREDQMTHRSLGRLLVAVAAITTVLTPVASAAGNSPLGHLRAVDVGRLSPSTSGAAVAGEGVPVVANLVPALDTSFSGDGRFRYRFPGSLATQFRSIASWGPRVAGVGFEQMRSPYRARGLVVVTDPAGVPDVTFSGDGVRRLSLPKVGLLASAVAPGPGGTLMVSGVIHARDGFQAFVARLKLNGALDRSFSGDGLRRIRFGDLDPLSGFVMVVDSLGRTVVGAVVARPAPWHLEVVRLTSDGVLDRSFAGDGVKVIHDTGSDVILYDAAVDGQDSVLLAYGGASGTKPSRITRLTTTGRFDPSFNGTGKLPIASLGADGSAPVSVEVGTGGRVSAVVSSFGPEVPSVMMRWNLDGTADANLDGDGAVSIPCGLKQCWVTGGHVLPSGGYVVLRELPGQHTERLQLFRFHYSGAPVGNFGTGGGGVVVLSEQHQIFPLSSSLDDTGRLLLAGSPSPYRHGLLARINLVP